MVAALVGLAWFAGSLVPGCTADLADGPFRKRFAHGPPQAAFEFSFNRRVPQDVTDLRATGESWIAGTNVWLRFNASDRTIRELAANLDRKTFDKAEFQHQEEMWSTNRRHYDPDDALGWNELHAVRAPEYYTRSNGGGGQTSLWVDRRSSVVYVQILGI